MDKINSNSNLYDHTLTDIMEAIQSNMKLFLSNK